MRKNFTRFVLTILFTTFAFAGGLRASGQTAHVLPTTLYRFEVSPFDGGHLLTGHFEEGPANSYTYDPIARDGLYALGIYVPPFGYTPDPSSGLVPLYRWTVIQDGWRTHYYYSTYYTQQPADRYFNGIAGYVFPPGTTSRFGIGLQQLSVYYSTDLGFWNGLGSPGYGFVESPPNRPYRSPYVDQGIIAACPPAVWDPTLEPNIGPPTGTPWDVIFYAPGSAPGSGGDDGGTPPSCQPSSGQMNACTRFGGTWDYESCSCQY
jgi:hypothetical protein